MKDIVILGCGYSGMIAALALSHKGISSTIIEKSPCRGKFLQDPRTISINLKSKDFLEEINLWKHLKEYAADVNDIYVMHNYQPETLHFNKNELDLSGSLGYMIDGSSLKQTLFSLVKENKLIKLTKSVGYSDVSFDGEVCNLTLEDGTLLKPDLVIVSDGRNSIIKDKYFGYSVNKCYGEAAFVFNIWHEKAHNNAAIEHFLPTGPFATLPLLDQNESAVVWSIESELASMYKLLDKKDLTHQIQKILGNFWGEVKIINNIQLFNLTAQVTDKYFFKNLVLVGDAAHHIHPLAGQGLNLGIIDIASLSKIISRYFNLGLELNEIALKDYQKSRKYDNLKMFFATDFIDKIFRNQSLPSKVIKKVGFNFLNCFPRLKNQIIKATMS